jgi:predicted outer membrane repeat protein
MKRPLATLLPIVSLLAAGGPLMAQPAMSVGVRVIIENRAPENGTYLTPFWVGFHSGGFDSHDLGFQAVEALERLAEDGDTAPFMEEFAAMMGTSQQATIASDEGIPPLAPGETATMSFVLDGDDPANRFFSYAAMVIPSNDAFVANGDPGAHQIFDMSGNFMGAAFTIYGDEVKDAGTEVNDEVPEHTAFFGQTVPDSGVDEFGVVHMHPGFLPPGSGGILDDPMFANADFTSPGYEIAQVTIFRSDTSIESGAVSGAWTLEGSPYLILGDIIVPQGQTLTIEPGVQVVFQNAFRFFVEGTLVAEGTSENPIRFTAAPNVSGWGGLRFFFASDDCVVSHCIFERGVAQPPEEPYDRGGAIYCESSNPLIADSLFDGNQAQERGGAIFCLNAAPTIAGNTFRDNIAGLGTASASGGAIRCEASSPVIEDNLFKNNRASASNPFSVAHGRGGAISMEDSGGVIQRNVFDGNYAGATGNVGTDAMGGAIHCDGSSPEISNNTLVANALTGTPNTEHFGAGLYLYLSSPQIFNNVIAANDGHGVYFDFNSDAASVRYNDVYANVGGDYAGDYAPAGIGIVVQENANGDPADACFNISLDPLLVDVAAEDYSLQPDSPCIDAGDPATPDDPDGAIADIGAFYFAQDVLEGDLNGDGVVNVFDLLQLLDAWGPSV